MPANQGAGARVVRLQSNGSPAGLACSMPPLGVEKVGCNGADSGASFAIYKLSSRDKSAAGLTFCDDATDGGRSKENQPGINASPLNRSQRLSTASGLHKISDDVTASCNTTRTALLPVENGVVRAVLDARSKSETTPASRPASYFVVPCKRLTGQNGILDALRSWGGHDRGGRRGGGSACGGGVKRDDGKHGNDRGGGGKDGGAKHGFKGGGDSDGGGDVPDDVHGGDLHAHDADEGEDTGDGLGESDTFSPKSRLESLRSRGDTPVTAVDRCGEGLGKVHTAKNGTSFRLLAATQEFKVRMEKAIREWEVPSSDPKSMRSVQQGVLGSAGPRAVVASGEPRRKGHAASQTSANNGEDIQLVAFRTFLREVQTEGKAKELKMHNERVATQTVPKEKEEATSTSIEGLACAKSSVGGKRVRPSLPETAVRGRRRFCKTAIGGPKLRWANCANSESKKSSSDFSHAHEEPLSEEDEGPPQQGYGTLSPVPARLVRLSRRAE